MTVVTVLRNLSTATTVWLLNLKFYFLLMQIVLKTYSEEEDLHDRSPLHPEG